MEIEWEKYNDYYNGIHDVTRDLTEFCRENDIPWLPASIPDPYILVESQIEPTVPQPEFRGRDDDLDSAMAKRREFAVRYIAENNRLSDMNTRNERRLLKLGDAFWKAYWDEDMRCGEAQGDIRVSDIPVEAVFPDPAVRGGSVQDGQYLDYVYRIHKVRFAQVFRADLEELGITAEEALGEDYVPRGEIFDMTSALSDTDDTVQVLEHWFRQPVETSVDGETIPAGAVACSVQAGGHELRYIPNYWRRTGAQNTLFPFVHYWRIQDENRFWNKSELSAVLDLVDAADRKLASALLNDSFLSNDILLVEDGALADGEELITSRARSYISSRDAWAACSASADCRASARRRWISPGSRSRSSAPAAATTPAPARRRRAPRPPRASRCSAPTGASRRTSSAPTETPGLNGSMSCWTGSAWNFSTTTGCCISARRRE